MPLVFWAGLSVGEVMGLPRWALEVLGEGLAEYKRELLELQAVAASWPWLKKGDRDKILRAARPSTRPRSYEEFVGFLQSIGIAVERHGNSR